jgi:serine/threonine-protein kinase
MGQVYLAEHVKMGRKSALKVMNPALVKDADAISRFNREASNASRINHPNVAAIYDFGETADGIIYLAMEVVDGPPLTKLLEETGPLPPSRAASIVRQTADALAVAHDMGIVHRDLKPDNIMVARNRDGTDLVKVVDFGIAKAADNAAQKVTKTGLVVGTPEYMSPEQLAGDRLDGRSDIYALALVAFNMLTGRLPFPAETVQESMIMRLTEAPKKLSEMRPEVAWSPRVQGVLDRALERDANLRYATATEFGADLGAALEGMGAVSGAGRAGDAGRVDATMPPTRVRSPAPAAGAVAAPRIAAGGSPPPHTRHAPRKMLLTAGGLVLVGVLATAMVMRRDPGKVRQSGNVTPAGQAPSDVSPPRDTTRYAGPVDSSAFRSRPAVDPEAAAGVGTAAVSEALDSLAKVVSGDATPAQAEGVLRELHQMRGRIRGDQQIVQAGIVEAFAQSTRHHQAEACAALRRIEPAARGTRRATYVTTAIAAASCP